MKAQSIAALVASALLVVAVWLQLRGGSDEPEAQQPIPDAPATATRTVHAPELEPRDAPAVLDTTSTDRTAAAIEKPTPPPTELLGRSVAVRVVDASGNGLAGCPISVECEGGAERQRNSMLHMADDTGWARIPEESFVQVFGRIEDDALFVLDIGLPLRQRVSHRANWSVLFDREIELRAPALGAIEIEVLRGGIPLDLAASIELEVTFETLPSESVIASKPGSSAFRQSLENGRTRFNNVPLGLRFWPTVSLPTGKVAQPDPLVGPLADQEVVRTQIDLEDVPHLTFRLLDGIGNPIANQPIMFTKFDGSPTGPSYATTDHAQSDALGRCIVQWAAPFPEGGTRSLDAFIAPHSNLGAAAAKRAGTVRRTFEEAFRPGPNDLGDLRLTPLLLLVAGRVVDSSRNPIADARIFLQITRNADESSRTSESEPLHSPQDPRAKTVTTEVATTDPAGGFEIYHAPIEGKTAIRARAVDYEPGDFVPFAPGTSHVELTLGRGSSVSGNVVLPAFLERSSVRARLLGRDAVDIAGSMPAPSMESAIDEDGGFGFTGLSAGAYDFELDAGPLRPAITVSNVVVPPDTPVADPRLKQLSLEGRLVEIDVTITDVDDTPIDSAHATVAVGSDDPSMERPPLARTDAAGKLRLVVASAGQTVIAGADGYRPSWRENVKGDVTLRLSKSLDVTFRARGESPLARGNRTLGLYLTPVAGAAWEAHALHTGNTTANVPFVGSRDSRVAVAFPGRYRVHWFRSESAPNLLIQVGIGGDQEIELIDTTAPQVVEVDPPPTGLDDR